MRVKNDLKRKIDTLSEKMDEQLSKDNFQEYQRLADTYLRMIREYESLDKDKINRLKWDEYETPSNPLNMKKFTNLTCKTTRTIDGELYQLEVKIPEGELEFDSEEDKDRIKISGHCQMVDYIIKNKIN